MTTDFNLDRGLPASPDAEKAILGAIILENDLWKDASADIEAQEFFLDAHRKVFAAMAELAEDGQPIDTMFLAEALGRRKELEAIGGIAYLSTLTDGVPRRASISHYVKRVRDHAVLRNLIHAANGIISQAIDATDPADKILDAAQTSLLEIALGAGSRDKDIFVDATEFCAGEDTPPDWLVEGLIERGSNGLACADPKGAKSLTFAANLSVCLGMGIPFLDLKTKRCRVAIVSREDNPSTTKRRIRQIVKGKGASMQELEGWLYVNSKEQSPSLMLDNPREVNNLIRCLQRRNIEFVIFDVFNKLHNQDENDNTKVRAVMNQFDKIQAATGAQMCVLHHWNKGDANQSLTRRARGAGAIAGFAEWIAGIELVDEENQTRRMSFETKVGEYLAPIHYQVIDNFDKSAVTFRIVSPIAVPDKKSYGKRAE